MGFIKEGDLNKELFIPSPIHRKRKSRVTNKQRVIGILSLALGALIFGLRFVSVDQNYLPGKERSLQIWGTLIIVLILEYFIFKNIVINVKKIIKEYKKFLLHQICTVNVCHSIIRYEEDGRLFYADGSEGYIIKLERAYAYGRPAGFVNNSYSNFTRVFTNLLEEGYRLYWGLLNTGKSEIRPLIKLSRNIQKHKSIISNGHSIAELPMALLSYNQRLVENKKTPMEYLMIRTNGVPLQSKRLKLNTVNTISLLQDSIYENSEVISSKQDHLEFERVYFELNNLYESDLYRRNENTSSVIQIVNREKPEETFDDLDSFDLRADGTEYDKLLSALNKANEENESISNEVTGNSIEETSTLKQKKSLRPLKKKK